MRSQPDSDRLASELRRVLVRPQLPDGLTARVMSEIRREGSPRPAVSKRRWTFSGRFAWAGWALAGCAAGAFVLFAVATPEWREGRRAEQPAMVGHERQLAEVLHLAGSKWNQAQRAAFPPPPDDTE